MGDGEISVMVMGKNTPSGNVVSTVFILVQEPLSPSRESCFTGFALADRASFA